MPTYDYKCKECGHLFEEFQSMSSDHLLTCPSCGKPGLVRLMAGGVAMIFKGSGFYQTDYKNTGSSSSTSSSKSDSSQPEKSPTSPSSSDSSKTDKKPASTSSSDSSKSEKKSEKSEKKSDSPPPSSDSAKPEK